MDLGNTHDHCHSRRGDHRSVLKLPDRDQGGRFASWSWQDMTGTLRQVEQMRQIERRDGRVYLGSIPSLHYAELLRLRRLEGMDDEAWQNLVRSYLSHRSFSRFKGAHGFRAWSPWNWFFEILDDPKELTGFYARRRADMGILR